MALLVTLPLNLLKSPKVSADMHISFTMKIYIWTTKNSRVEIQYIILGNGNYQSY